MIEDTKQLCRVSLGVYTPFTQPVQIVLLLYLKAQLILFIILEKYYI